MSYIAVLQNDLLIRKTFLIKKYVSRSFFLTNLMRPKTFDNDFSRKKTKSLLLIVESLYISMLMNQNLQLFVLSLLFFFPLFSWMEREKRKDNNGVLKRLQFYLRTSSFILRSRFYSQIISLKKDIFLWRPKRAFFRKDWMLFSKTVFKF